MWWWRLVLVRGRGAGGMGVDWGMRVDSDEELGSH